MAQTTPAACLMAGDMTPFGEVEKVKSLDRRNILVRVWFKDGSSRAFSNRESVPYVPTTREVIP
jgi:hypothetical protein